MKFINKTFCITLSAALCLMSINGCASSDNPAPAKTSSNEDIKQEITSETSTPSDITLTDDDIYSENSSADENLGSFSMQDIEGETYTEEMFQDYTLTMVNIFTTWCSPCINEIPDLQKLKNEMADQGFNVTGIVLDAVDASGNAEEETIEVAKLLAEKTGVSYTFLIPDPTFLNGRLSSIEAVPETFFVDKNGNIVGETYTGSRSLEDWKSIVETELANLAVTDADSASQNGEAE